MFVEMTCGSCEAHFQMDAEDNDTGVWSLVYRFTDAHSACGYVAPVRQDPVERHVRMVKAKVRNEDASGTD